MAKNLRVNLTIEKDILMSKLSGMVHTRDESLQDRLRDMWTC